MWWSGKDSCCIFPLYLDDTEILFLNLYITEYTALVNFFVRHAELTCLNSWCPGLQLDPVKTQTSETNQSCFPYPSSCPLHNISTPIFSLKKLWRVINPLPGLWGWKGLLIGCLYREFRNGQIWNRKEIDRIDCIAIISFGRNLYNCY